MKFGSDGDDTVIDGDWPEPRRLRDGLTKTRVLGFVFALFFLVSAVAIGSVVSLRGALVDARAGRDAVSEFRSGFDLVGDLDETRADLESANLHFADATEHLDSVWLSVARRVPIIGTQIDSAESLATGGLTASAIAITAIDEATVVIDGDTSDRLAVVSELSAIAQRARAGLAAIDLGPESGTIGRLSDVRATLARELGQADADLLTVQDLASGIGDVLEGPTSFLLLVGNNAEMRGGSGSFLSAGIVSFDNADIEVTDLASVHEYEFDRARVVGSDSATQLWTDIEHTTDWQLLGSSPRFDWTAPLALAMWEDANGDKLDGVVAVDAVVLEALLEVTGPVPVDGRVFRADEVLFELLYGQYFSVTSDNYKTYNETQIQRRDRLSALARETLGALEERDIEIPRLIDHLSEAIAGRHLMVWSPEHDDLWDMLEVDGELTDASVAVSLINAGGNKLDYWTKMFAGIEITEGEGSAADGGTGEGGTVEVELSVRVRVDPPENAPRYVVGPHPDIAENAGDYLGVMAFHLPSAATDITMLSGQPVRAQGSDGPTQAVLVDVMLEAGGSTDAVLSFRLPATHPPLVIEPSARIPATRWLHEGDRWDSGPAVEISVAAGRNN